MILIMLPLNVLRHCLIGVLGVEVPEFCDFVGCWRDGTPHRLNEYPGWQNLCHRHYRFMWDYTKMVRKSPTPVVPEGE